MALARARALGLVEAKKRDSVVRPSGRERELGDRGTKPNRPRPNTLYPQGKVLVGLLVKKVPFGDPAAGIGNPAVPAADQCAIQATLVVQAPTIPYLLLAELLRARHASRPGAAAQIAR